LKKPWPSANAQRHGVHRALAGERRNVVACRDRSIAVGLVEEVRKVLAAAGK
jgi:hypothetical protein